MKGRDYMSKRIIATEMAPKALGPYSQAVAAKGEMIFVSGQIPIDPATNTLIDGDVTAQTIRCLENIKAILEQAGASLADVVKTNIFIKNMDDFATINAAYAPYFPENPPARGCVEVACLPKDVLVEIEATAII